MYTIVRYIVVAHIVLLSLQLSAHAQSEQYKAAYSAYQTQNFSEAGKIWEGLAENGDINAQYALGVMELRGETGNPTPLKAFQWFDKAAKQGHSTAMFNIGVAYWEGSGVKKDRQAALDWWNKSASAGNSGAQFNLGLAYYIGEEKTQDIKTAAKWIGMAATQNHPEAKRIYSILLQDNPDLKQIDITTLASTDTDDAKKSYNFASPIEIEVEQTSSGNNNQTTANTNEYWKTSNSITLRTAVGSSGSVFGTLPQGTPIEIIETNGGWSLVTVPTGLKVWVFEKFLNALTEDKGRIQGVNVRIRPKPSTNNNVSPPLGVYNNGEDVVLLEKQSQWYHIRAPKRIGGWTQSKYLESYQDTEQNRFELWNLMMAKGL